MSLGPRLSLPGAGCWAGWWGLTGKPGLRDEHRPWPLWSSNRGWLSSAPLSGPFQGTREGQEEVRVEEPGAEVEEAKLQERIQMEEEGREERRGNSSALFPLIKRQNLFPSLLTQLYFLQVEKLLQVRVKQEGKSSSRNPGQSLPIIL